MTCLSPSNFKLIYLIQCCAQKNEFYKLCMKMLMSLQSNNKSRISYLFKSWFKNLIFFSFMLTIIIFVAASLIIQDFFFNIILIERVVTIWNYGEEELFVWIFISFAHISSLGVSCFCALSLIDSVMTDSHSLVSQKKDLSGFSSLVLSCLFNSSSW